MVQSLCGNPVVQKCPVVLLWYLCGTPVVHVGTTEITTGMRNIPHTFCGNGPRHCVVILWYIQVLKFPVVLLCDTAVWYCCVVLLCDTSVWYVLLCGTAV